MKVNRWTMFYAGWNGKPLGFVIHKGLIVACFIAMSVGLLG